MKSLRYRVLSFDEAMKMGFGEDLTCYGQEYQCGVFEMTGDKPIKMLGCDGGEPEDQTLCRDWSWVVGALNEAHQKGFREAQSFYEQ